MKSSRYFKFSDFLKKQFGSAVYKVTLDAGFTCPNRDGVKGTGGCSFCNNDAFSPARAFREKPVTLQLEEGMTRMRQGRRKAEKFMAYFQPFSNTYAAPEKLRELFHLPLSYPQVVSIAAGTRPDCLGIEILPVLAEMAKKTSFWLEIGLESSHDVTLSRIQRGHTWQEFLDAYDRVRGISGLQVCFHLIQGLPGEDEGMMLETVRRVNRLKPAAVKFHQLEIVKGTALESEFKENKVTLLPLSRSMEILGRSLEMLDPEIVIQRLFGFTPSSYLVAPQFSGHGGKLLDFETYLENHQIVQGARYEI